MNNNYRSPFVICYLLFAICYLLFIPSVNAQDESTPASSEIRDLVREKVTKKLETLTKKPKAAIGTLEQLTGTSIEIKNSENKITFVSANENTKYFRFTNGVRKDIRSEDLVLSEYVVAMGYNNTNDILDATRILAYDSPPKVEKISFLGTVKEIKKGFITVDDSNGNSLKVKTTTKTMITETGLGDEDFSLDRIGENYKIIVIGTLDPKNKNTFNATRVHILTEYTSKKPPSTPKPTKKPITTPTI